jgi:hypothetical protein
VPTSHFPCLSSEDHQRFGPGLILHVDLQKYADTTNISDDSIHVLAAVCKVGMTIVEWLPAKHDTCVDATPTKAAKLPNRVSRINHTIASIFNATWYSLLPIDHIGKPITTLLKPELHATTRAAIPKATAPMSSAASLPSNPFSHWISRRCRRINFPIWISRRRQNEFEFPLDLVAALKTNLSFQYWSRPLHYAAQHTGPSIPQQ